MWKFFGTVNGSVDSQAKDLPMVIKSFLLTNISGGNINISVTIGGINILPDNLLLNDGDMVDSDHEILMLANDQISITSTGNLDYFFTIANAKID